MTWACTDPHARCFDDTCNTVVCLGEDPAALDHNGHVYCPEHREEAA